MIFALFVFIVGVALWAFAVIQVEAPTAAVVIGGILILCGLGLVALESFNQTLVLL